MAEKQLVYALNDRREAVSYRIWQKSSEELRCCAKEAVSHAMRSKKRSSRESYASREGLSLEENAKSSELR